METTKYREWRNGIIAQYKALTHIERAQLLVDRAKSEYTRACEDAQDARLRFYNKLSSKKFMREAEKAGDNANRVFRKMKARERHLKRVLDMVHS